MQKVGSPALKVLNISSMKDLNVLGATLKKLVTNCPNLVSLSLYGGEDDVVTDKAVQAIATNCLRLEKLELWNRCELNDTSLMYLASLKHLKDLSMEWSPDLATSSESMYKFFHFRGSTLEVLSLQINGEECAIIDMILAAVGHFCSRLRVFHCSSEFDLITNTAVTAMVRGCPLLEDLSISVTLSTWDALDDDVMVALSESCPRLKTVTLSEHRSSPKFTDAGLIALSHGCPDLTQLYIHRTHTITDTAILTLAEHCHKLHSLTLSANGLITSAAVCALLEANPDVTSVTLKGSSLINDEIIHSLAQARCRLAYISLEGCQDLTVDSLVALLSRCTSLCVLSLHDSAAVSDALVDTVIHYCILLHSIRFVDCPLITGRSVASLVQSSNQLSQISIKDCGLRESDATSGLYLHDKDPDGNATLHVDLSRPDRHKPWTPPDALSRHIQKFAETHTNDEGCIIA